jgi:hypothetical protein
VRVNVTEDSETVSWVDGEVVERVTVRRELRISINEGVGDVPVMRRESEI